MGSDVARPEHGVFRPVHEGAHVRVLGDEAVVHVAATDEWHVLDARGVAVLDAVDGRRDSAAVATATGLTVDETCVILAELATQGVLLPPAGVTRRSLLQRAALVGGVAAGASVLGSVAAPFVAAAGSTTTPGTRVSLRSTTSGEETLFVTGNTNSNTQATMAAQVYETGPLTTRQLATFTIVSGLSGTGISFQSVYNTSWYLRHAGRVMYVFPTNNTTLFNQDASFVPVAGLSGIGTSLRGVTPGYTDQYIRRDGTALFLRLPSETPATFDRDASFYLAAPLAP